MLKGCLYTTTDTPVLAFNVRPISINYARFVRTVFIAARRCVQTDNSRFIFRCHRRATSPAQLNCVNPKCIFVRIRQTIPMTMQNESTGKRIYGPNSRVIRGNIDSVNKPNVVRKRWIIFCVVLSQ